MATYKNRPCQFCINKTDQIDYKNLKLIKKYLTQYFKIVPRYYSGNCINHQKKLTKAVKNARMIALVPFTK